MNKFCSNCGNEINEHAVICVKCGVPVSNIQVSKQKQPGKGLSIASMVLGIIAIFYGLIFSLTSTLVVTIDEFYYYEAIIFAIMFNFWPLILSITGLSLGIAGRSKMKNGMNLAGIILSSITIFLCIVSICISIIL